MTSQHQGASRPQKQDLWNPVPKAPVRGKLGHSRQQGLTAQKALQIHSGLWAAVKPPVVNGTISISVAQEGGAYLGGQG